MKYAQYWLFPYVTMARIQQKVSKAGRVKMPRLDSETLGNQEHA
jgi:hypothetical protein